MAKTGILLGKEHFYWLLREAQAWADYQTAGPPARAAMLASERPGHVRQRRSLLSGRACGMVWDQWACDLRYCAGVFSGRLSICEPPLVLFGAGLELAHRDVRCTAADLLDIKLLLLGHELSAWRLAQTASQQTGGEQ